MNTKVKIPIQLTIRLTGNPENGIVMVREGFKIEAVGTYIEGIVDLKITIDDYIEIADSVFNKIKEIQQKRC